MTNGYCLNEDGTRFQCIYDDACKDGTGLDLGICIDTDECTDVWDASAIFTITARSYTSVYDTEYTGDSTGCADIDEFNVGSDVACGVNFDCINTISSLTCTTVTKPITKQALTELMLMPLDHILVAVMLFSVVTDSFVPISTNIWLLHVTLTLSAQTQAALSPVHVMLPTMVMISTVLSTTMSAAQMNAGGRISLLTHALLTIPKFDSPVPELAFQLKLTVASLSIPMLTTLQWR